MVPHRSALAVRALLVAACLLGVAGVVAAVTTGEDRPADLAVGAGADAPATPPTLPPVTLPPVTLPAVTLPPITVPPVELPEITLPPLPPLTIPPVPLLEPPGLLYVQPAGATRELLQLTWSGRVVQRLQLDRDIDCCGLQTSTPDGSILSLGGEMYDRDGRYLGQRLWGDWADDDQHQCALWRHDPADPQGPQDLVLRERDGVTSRIVATVPAADAGTGSFVASCSPRHDRAVVVLNNPPNRRTFVVRLSDGATREITGDCGDLYSVSADQRLIVASSPEDRSGIVCDIDTGTVIGHLPQVGAIAGDGRVLVTSEVDECGWYHRLVLSDWQTGERFWDSSRPGYELPCNQSYSTWRYHPSTSAMAMQVTTLEERAPGAVYLTDGRHAPRRIVERAAYAVVF